MSKRVSEGVFEIEILSSSSIAGRHAQQHLSTVIWAGVMAVVKANGRQFCPRPRLCGLIQGRKQ